MSVSPSPSIQRAILADRYAIRRKLGSGSGRAVCLTFGGRESREFALMDGDLELVARSLA